MKNNVNLNNDQFLSLINERNSEAFHLLFKLYRSKLLHFAYGYVSNKEDAEEIIQDVFIKIWRTENIHTNINAYIYKITRNACLDYLRKKKLTLNIENNTSQLEATVNFNALADDFASKIIEKELEEVILEAADLLPHKCKNIFLLSRFEGLKHKEISEKLDISTKTIENQMTKALKHMRLYLRDFLSFL
jgi:RNA polymerase sigma-70 factor (ECF subfamily)